jgi:hypothetical protein
MAEPNPKPAVAAKPRRTAPLYEMVQNETGAFVRVPVGTAPPRPAILTAAVQGSAAAAARRPESPPAEDVEEELVFNNTGELTGNARNQALAARTTVTEQGKVDDDELVFNETGELTGEAREAAVAAVRTVAQVAPAASRPARKAKDTKGSKAVRAFEKASEDEKVKLFYLYRSKFPQYFVYTAEGNLEIKENPKEIPPGVLTLRAFSPLRPEELEEIEQKQDAERKAAEEEYVVKLRQLREAHDTLDPMNTESLATVVRLNEELREISVLRNKALYPEQWCKEIESVDTRRILLDQPHEERKLGYPVYLFKRFGLSRADAEGHYREHGEAASAGMEGGGTVVLFITDPEDPHTGQFHPAAEREFVYNETRYASPYQAFETERFKELEDDGMVKKLLGTRSAKTIKNLVSLESKQPQFPLKLWEEILEAFYTQFKDATETLKATGSARFHMMDKQIGTPEYANALANVRTKLKEKENDAPGLTDQVKQSVITENEQKKAKVGAIINTFRRHG